MKRRFAPAAVLAAGVLLGLSPPALAAPDAPVDLSGVEVAADVSVRLTVALAGDMTDQTFVTSAPSMLNCGGAQFRFQQGEARSCWVWTRRKRPVLLAAQSNGRYGLDWKVSWTGCEPIDTGAVCRLTPEAETLVSATITRLR